MRKVVLLFWLMGFAVASGEMVLDAQSDDCGNGFAQRLTVGGQGRVIPDPPVNVRIRDAPDGAEIGKIGPGERFTVLSGPECAKTYSWWQIETENGLVGWSAEAGTVYFLEPFGDAPGLGTPLGAVNPPITNDNLPCEGEPTFTLGQQISLLVPPEQIEWYYGHPLLQLYSVWTYFSLLGNTETQDGYVQGLNDDFLLLEGAICFNGLWFWKVRPASEESISYLSLNSPSIITRFPDPLWIAEGDRVSLSATQPPVGDPTYDPEFVTLREINSAPIISPEGQIMFDGPGLGGIGQFGFINVPDCPIGEGTHVTWQYAYDCIYLFPFETGSTVQVVLYQPDGTVFMEETLTAKAIKIGIHTNTANEFEPVTVGAVHLELPYRFGLQSGMWRVEGRAGERVIATAHLRENQAIGGYETDPYRGIRHYCDGQELIFLVTGFEPEQPLNIVLVERQAMDPSGAWVANFSEKYRWAVTTGAHGELMFQTNFVPDAGYFAITEPDAAWQPSIPWAIHGYPVTTQLGVRTLDLCSANSTLEFAMKYPLAYGNWATGTFRGFGALARDKVESFHVFEGQAGDVVTITLRSLVDYEPDSEPVDLEMDTVVRLLAPDGSIIAENDNADDPRWLPTDAEIRDFVLPEDGLYTIVGGWVANPGPFALLLEESS